MCLAVPAKVDSIQGTKALVTAFGCQEEVDIRLLSSVDVDDFVLVHVGFALEKIHPEDAAFLIEAWQTPMANGGSKQ